MHELRPRHGELMVPRLPVLVVARNRRIVRAVRDLGSGLLTTLVAAILIFGLLRAGSRYFYCDAMGTVGETSCCDAPHHGSGEQIEVRMDDCCKPRSVGSLPVVVIQTPPVTPPAPLVAVLSSVASSARLKASIRREAFRANFTGPPLLSPSDHRARLMVFLI